MKTMLLKYLTWAYFFSLTCIDTRNTARVRCDFINILGAPFLYKSILHSFSLITVWLCTILAKEYWHKSCSKNVDEIDYRTRYFVVLLPKIAISRPNIARPLVPTLGRSMKGRKELRNSPKVPILILILKIF